MKRVRFVETLLGVAVLATAVLAVEEPAFPYDRSKTFVYLGQTLHASSSGPATELRKELAAVVDEILDGPWQPLYSDYSAGEAGGVGTAEWCFTRPGDYVRALSLAAPHITPQQTDKARAFLRNLIKTFPPTQHVTLPAAQGKPRSVRKTPPPAWDIPGSADAERSLFTEAYAVWAYAHAFDAWDEVHPIFDDLRRLRGQLDNRGDFTPAHALDYAGLLTAAEAGDPQYRFTVFQSLLAGFQDNYGYRGAQETRKRMQKDRPVFFYVKHLSALIGYYRLAHHFGKGDEAEWAWQTFDKVAAMALGQKSAPYLWSDPYLCPEVGRVIRDAAGPWLDELANTANVGNLPAVDWDNRIVPNRRDNVAMNPYTWYHAWGGQGEGIRPRAVMGAFLVHAYLFNASAPKIVRALDIPWCRADLHYVQKLVVAIGATERAGWMAVK